MHFRFITALIAGAALLTACGGGGGSTATVPTTAPAPVASSTLSVTLMDAPFQATGGTVSAVNITVSKVEAIDSSGNPQTVGSFSPSKQINLMDYQTSGLALGSATIHSGQYHQIRLVLDTSSPNNNSVVVNDTTYPLMIPGSSSGGFGGATSTDSGDGAGTAGIRVNLSFAAQEQQTYAYVIDFNAAESIGQTGNGQWIMKPTLVTAGQSAATFISGSVKNNSGSPVSGAQVAAEDSGGNIVNTGVTDVNGNFRINALTSGQSYTIVVNNNWTCQAGVAQTATGADGTDSVSMPSPVTAPASGLSITD